jgi:hypothetical protein
VQRMKIHMPPILKIYHLTTISNRVFSDKVFRVDPVKICVYFNRCLCLMWCDVCTKASVATSCK